MKHPITWYKNNQVTPLGSFVTVAFYLSYVILTALACATLGSHLHPWVGPTLALILFVVLVGGLVAVIDWWANL